MCLNGPATGDSHHRQTTSQEFGYDIVVLGNSGKVFWGTGKRNVDYCGFRKPILAPAAGKVIVAKDGLPDNEKLLQSPPLSRGRVNRWGFEQAAAGNFVVLRHGGNEFSLLAHCSNGSIEVKQGDRVKQGQRIARIGNSGNSTGPHLHYHLMEGPDLLLSRSIPVQFSNLYSCFDPQERSSDFFSVRDPYVLAK